MSLLKQLIVIASSPSQVLAHQDQRPYGLQSAPQGIFAELIHWANDTRASIGELVLSDIGIPAGDLPAYWRLV